MTSEGGLTRGKDGRKRFSDKESGFMTPTESIKWYLAVKTAVQGAKDLADP